MGAHPLPPTPTPLTFDHAWRLEPSDRRRTGCDLMCAHKRVGYRARYVGGDDQVVARVVAWMQFRVRRTDKPVGWQPPWVSDPLDD